MNLIERFFGRKVPEEIPKIPEERLNKQSDELWAYPLTYHISLKIFSEHMRLFDLFEKARAVSKSWRWMASQEEVMNLALRSLGLTLPPQKTPRDYFRMLSKGLAWIERPMEMTSAWRSRLRGELIAIADHNPNIFSEQHLQILEKTYPTRLDVRLFLSLLRRQEAKESEFQRCRELLSQRGNKPWLDREHIESPQPYVRDYYSMLSYLPHLFKNDDRANGLCDFLATNKEFLTGLNEEKVNYQQSGIWIKAEELRFAHFVRWKEAVRNAHDTSDRPDVRKEIKRRWPELFRDDA